jgi:hypothetical protein
MTGMASPEGSFEPRKYEASGAGHIQRATPDLVVRFNGKEFLPSKETELGAALLGNLSKRSTGGQYSVSFKQPYLVDLCIGSGGAFTKSPLAIQGFVLGQSPSGAASVLQLISPDGRKIRLPIVIVTEKGGEWHLVDTPLGWNREISACSSKGDPSGRNVSFKEPGVFLVVQRSESEGIVPMPIAIHSAMVTDRGRVIKARSSDGRVFEPTPEVTNFEPQVDLKAQTLPPGLESSEEDYALAPLESTKEPSPASVTESLTSSDSEIRPAPKGSRWTRGEERDFHMELALRRLLIREKGLANKDRAATIGKMLAACATKDAGNETPLTDACKRIILAAGTNPRANLIASICRKWIEDHHDRPLWKELIWKDYYKDLTTIAPLLCGMESDLNRSDTDAYDKRLAERRKR